MTFKDIERLVLAGRVEALHVESSTRDSFYYRAFLEGCGWILTDSRGQPVRDRSLGHARQRLREAGGFERVPLFLVQRRAAERYAEIGGASYRHQTPLSLASGSETQDDSLAAAYTLTGRDSLACSPR